MGQKGTGPTTGGPSYEPQKAVPEEVQQRINDFPKGIEVTDIEGKIR